MTLSGPTRWSAPIAIWHPVDRPRLLHLLAWANCISFLEELRERGTRSFGDRLLKLLGQICEGDVRMNRLDIAQQLIGQPARTALQGRDPVEHRGEYDRLHDVGRSSRHQSFAITVSSLLVDLRPAAP
jgi:hypothetical protein